MKFGFGAAFAVTVLTALPGLALAQQHPEASHGGGPRPATHTPAPAMHAPSRPAPATHAPTSHSHALSGSHHPTTHSVRTSVHHTSHHMVHRTVHRSTVSRHVVRTVTHNRVVRTVHHSARIMALRRNVVAVHRFHAGIYRAPPGYVYRRWSFGAFLPAVYWGRNYWITDFLTFGLFAPPVGLVWVRYGPDALLIDEYTGEIIQVDYGVFF